MKYLIVNADDFGASSGINRGIIKAHRTGILTSTSLMVNMPAAREAVDMAADSPTLSIGLHVMLTEETGAPIVELCDTENCRAELARQVDRFQSLAGQLPTHLDSHHNIHRDPRVLPLFAAIAADYGLPLREHSPFRYFPNFYGQWDGETHLEQISVENLKAMLSNTLVSQFTELSCHPGYIDLDFESVYSIEREAELRTLCDPSLPGHLKGIGVVLGSFRDFAAQPASAGKGKRA
jgi:predicted glycoside hydrolase/deacetylase ChbG (UPF0249 family)